MSLSDVIKTALDQIQHIAKTETVIGEPIVAGSVTLIPVSKVSIGFAAGGAGIEEKGGSGAGTGGGINVTPIAFISICENKVEVLSMEPSSEPSFQKILSMAPDVFRKVSKYFSKKDEISDEEK